MLDQPSVPGVTLDGSHRVGPIAGKWIMEIIWSHRRSGPVGRDGHAEGVNSCAIEVDCDPSPHGRIGAINEIRGRRSVVRLKMAVKKFNEDLDTLRSLAGDTNPRLSKIPGVVDLQSDIKNQTTSWSRS